MHVLDAAGMIAAEAMIGALIATVKNGCASATFGMIAISKGIAIATMTLLRLLLKFIIAISHPICLKMPTAVDYWPRSP